MSTSRRVLRINFLLPGYSDEPVGGYRVVYEYADALAARGHEVRIIFPEYVTSPLAVGTNIQSLRRACWRVAIRVKHRPLVTWYRFDSPVRLKLVAELDERDVPDADVVIATAWNTAPATARLPGRKGKKYYLVQHYETMWGPKEEVDATWRLPMRKIVIARWLEDVGRSLGADAMRYIPNGIDLERFKVLNPPETRPMHVVTLNHHMAFKGVPDAVATLEMYHQKFPQVPVTMFGIPDRGSEIPRWISYVRDPDQGSLVRDIYNRATVYFGASLSEGMGLPPAEAMACGCAFVGTDIGGFREYATHEETALLSPPGNKARMLENLVRMTADDALRMRIQKQGTDHIRGLTWERAEVARFFRTRR